jgi:hypothetical protein
VSVVSARVIFPPFCEYILSKIGHEVNT